MARHNDMAAEMGFVRVEASQSLAFLGSEQLRQHRAAETVEVCCKRIPVIGADLAPSG